MEGERTIPALRIAGGVGGTYEARTVGALTFRSLVWVAISWLALRAGRRRG